MKLKILFIALLIVFSIHVSSADRYIDILEDNATLENTTINVGDKFVTVGKKAMNFEDNSHDGFTTVTDPLVITSTNVIGNYGLKLGDAGHQLEKYNYSDNLSISNAPHDIRVRVYDNGINNTNLWYVAVLVNNVDWYYIGVDTSGTNLAPGAGNNTTFSYRKLSSLYNTNINRPSPDGEVIIKFNFNGSALIGYINNNVIFSVSSITNMSTVQIGSSWYSYGNATFDEIRIWESNDGNCTTTYDSGSGNEIYKLNINFTSFQSGTNVTITTVNNNTGTQLEQWQNVTQPSWEQTLNSKVQDLKVVVNLIGDYIASAPSQKNIYFYSQSAATAPIISSYTPSTPNSTHENVGQIFNIDINQTANASWYVNTILMQTNTSVTSASYFNDTALNGTHNITVVVTNTNGTDSQTWNWTVLLNSVDFVYRNINYSNLTANCFIDISNKTAGLHTINIPWIGNLSSEYCLNYPNGTAVQSCVTCTDEGDAIWFNGSADRLPELNGYYISETESTTIETFVVGVGAFAAVVVAGAAVVSRRIIISIGGWVNRRRRRR